MKSLEQYKAMRLPRDPYPIDGFITNDENGVYMTGTFKYNTNLIVVSHNGGEWRMTIKSRTPLGIYQLRQLRALFLPKDIEVAFMLNGETGETYRLREVKLKDNNNEEE